MTILDAFEVKQFLGIGGSDQDAALISAITAAEAAWSASLLPSAVLPRTDELAGGSYTVAVNACPVVSVTAITEGMDNTTVDVADVRVNARSGVLTRRSGTFLDPVTVTYTWGFATLPADIKEALMLLTKHFYRPQRGGAILPGRGEQEAAPTAPYAWPNRVRDLAAPYAPIGFA